MNQSPLLNSMPSNATPKVSAAISQKSENSGSNNDVDQAFSSELKKQIDKPEVSKKADKAQTKETKSHSDADKVDNKKAELADNEDGKTLPEETDSVETETSGKAGDVAGLVSEELLENEGELAVDVPIGEGAESIDISVDADGDPIVQENKETSANNRDVIPAGLEQTEQVHNVVHQLKDIIADEKADGNKAVGKVVSDNVKNMVKPQQASEASSGIATSTNKDTEKSSGSEPAKLRPDIMQALTAKGSAESAKTVSQSESIKLASSGEVNLTTEKTLTAQVQIADLLEKAKSSTREAGNRIERAVANPLAALNSNQSTLGVKTEAPLLDIKPSLQNTAWSKVMSSRVVWMAKEGIQQAALKLNPANLGPVEVRLNMHNEQANVTFIAQNAATRDALEQAIPRLRESFSQNGLELSNADVSHQSSEQSQDEQAEQQMNSNANSQGTSQNGEDISEIEQELVDNGQDIDVGLSIYA